jgi:hypothetical protein
MLCADGAERAQPPGSPHMACAAKAPCSASQGHSGALQDSPKSMPAPKKSSLDEVPSRLPSFYFQPPLLGVCSFLLVLPAALAGVCVYCRPDCVSVTAQNFPTPQTGSELVPIASVVKYMLEA